MNGSVANKNHRESHDYDYDPLEVITYTSLMYLSLELNFFAPDKTVYEGQLSLACFILQTCYPRPIMMYLYDDLSNGDGKFA